LPIKVNLTNIRNVSCANDYITFVNNEGRVFVMGDLNVKGKGNTIAKNKTDII
jgi:hypothetical protein